MNENKQDWRDRFDEFLRSSFTPCLSANCAGCGNRHHGICTTNEMIRCARTQGEIENFISAEIAAAEKRGAERERDKWQEKRQCFSCEMLDRLLTREKKSSGIDNWYKQLWEYERKSAGEFSNILKKIIDNEPCEYDHHGNCQTHGLGNPCEVSIARAALKAYEEGK